MRRPAGAGHHRPHLPRPDRHALPAGRRPRQALHGRGRLQRAGHGAGPRRQRGRRGDQHALARRGVAHITIPKDIQDWTTADSERSEANIKRHSAAIFVAGVSACRRQAELQRAADVINAGKKVAILVGRGAARRAPGGSAAGRGGGGPGRSSRCWARRVVPDDSPYTTGGIGLLGTAPSQDAHARLRHARHRSAAASPTWSFCPSRARPRACRSTSIRHASACATRSTSAWSATASAVLQALLPLVQRKEDRSFLEQAQKNMKRVERAAGGARHAHRHADEAAGRGLPSQQVPGGRRDHRLRLRHGDDLGGAVPVDSRRHACSRSRACWRRWPTACPTRSRRRSPIPQRPVVAIVGDGGFTMLMGEMATIVKYKLPVKVIIIKNNTLGADQVGADGHGGQSRIRRRAAADRLRHVRRGVRRRRLHPGRSDEGRGRAAARRSRSRARR